MQDEGWWKVVKSKLKYSFIIKLQTHKIYNNNKKT